MVEKISNKKKTLKGHNFLTLMKRLSDAGFDGSFIRPALLPDWWEDECDNDPTVLPEFETRVARFLDTTIANVRNHEAPLVTPLYPLAQLRQVREFDSGRLTPAIHSATSIAAATVRNLRDQLSQPMIPPGTGVEWHKSIEPSGAAITLDDILSDLWRRGIPVVPLDSIPAPSFQAMVCQIDERPVILLGYKHDEPSRVAFLVAHEAGHLAAGDCEPGIPVLDGQDGILDESLIEKRADEYAMKVLIGDNSIPRLEQSEFKDLARESAGLEKDTGIDAGTIISAWASRTKDYTNATLALKALYRHSGARQKTLEYFNKWVDSEAATESDRDLLRCVNGEAESNEIIG